MRVFVKNKTAGMTLVEVIIAASVGVTLIGVVMSIWFISHRTWGAERMRTRQRLDMEIAMEQIKNDARISSSEFTRLYNAGSGDFTAVSMPTAQLTGSFLADAAGDVGWSGSVIYHLFAGELRRTEFIDNEAVLAVQANIANQLANIALNGDDSVYVAVNGETCITSTIAENVSEFRVVSSTFEFDGYSPTLRRSNNINFGSVSLDSGMHDFRFEVTDTSSPDDEYVFGIDTISVSPSGCAREAEFYVNNLSDDSGDPGNDSGLTATKEYQLGWSGNHYFEYPASAIGDFVNLRLYYDLYRESNFQNSIRNNTILAGDDLYVQLADHTQASIVNWEASAQTGSAALNYDDAVPVAISMANMTVRNVVDAASNSDLFRVRFQPHLTSGQIVISEAYLEQRSAGEDALPASPATRIRLYFTDGVGVITPGVTILAGSFAYSNWAIFPVVSTNDYFVTFHITSGNASYWHDTTLGAIHSYVVNDPALGADWISAADWTVNAGPQSQPLPDDEDECFSSPDVYVTSTIEGWSGSGSVTSAIYDTTQTGTLDYGTIHWTNGGAGAATMEVCSDDNAAMASPTSWLAATNGNSLPAGVDDNRFIRFRATLSAVPYWVCMDHAAITTTDDNYKNNGIITCALAGGSCAKFLIPGVVTPWVDDVTIDWPGGTRMCDISGFFTQDDDYGRIKLTVDGNELSKGLEFYMTLSENFQNNPIESSLATEVLQRNTGN